MKTATAETSRYDGDAIHIEQLELLAHVGVSEEERKARQRITLNATIWPNATFSALRDDISHAVDYAALAQSVRDFVEKRSDRLIETLAEATASHLLAEFPLRQVRLELRKYVLPNARYVSVILKRQAAP
jgi:7,8-dihydroneopterin aldolase/epimerase/oxygenase